uniref:Secreted Inositol polyphosphate phosphatase protein n=1 Tax=Pristhesancus plagipennis TaxID=1955184 RepID=A0A2K8JUN3_PRIPG|nr:secreted Inositol polyphosphate phosphatase protein [Pristhesancus plagipennis]
MKLLGFILMLSTLVSIECEEKYDLTELLGLLPEDPAQRPDVVIVGLQEVTMSLRKAIKNFLGNDKWNRTIDDTLVDKKYVKVKSIAMLGIVLHVYVKLDHAWTMDDVAFDRVMTGAGGFYANKGGVIIKFRLFNQHFCIVNAHFHAHDQELQQRINDYETISIERAQLCNYPTDYVFWLGDLNFRIEEDPSLTAEKIHSLIQKDKEIELLEKDQLLQSRKAEQIFNDFSEAPITFKPTYKLQPDTGEYNLKRRPAWTDRILYKSENNREITPILYKSIERYTISDHYPVQAQFKIAVDTYQY